MKPTLKDWFPESFADDILAQLTPPRSPETGEKLWEKGGRLHGQQRDFVLSPNRFLKMDGGVRFGKSYGPAMRVVLDSLWRAQRGITNDRWLLVGSTYEMAEAEMEHVHNIYEDLGILHNFHTPDGKSWVITFPDTAQEISTKSASDVTKIASKAYRGVHLCEGAQLNEQVWEKARARVSETGGWISMTGTFEKMKTRWYARKTKDWKRGDSIGVVYTCPSWDNPIAFPGGRLHPEIVAAQTDFPRSVFLEIWGGEPSMPEGIVLPEAAEDVHLAYRYPNLKTSFNPELPVWLFIDPGVSHAYAVWAVQFYASPELKTKWAESVIPTMPQKWTPRWSRERGAGNICWAIDLIYRWDEETHKIVAEAGQCPWAPNVVGAVYDFAATQHRAEGAPVIEQWAKYWPQFTGRSIDHHAEPVAVQVGYDNHRAALRNAWPEAMAQVEFNSDGRLDVVTDPAGLRLMMDPKCRAPMFGGLIAGREWEGEYYMHKNGVDLHGNRRGQGPIPLYDDAIKAMNYGLTWWFGSARQRLMMSGIYSAPFEVTVEEPSLLAHVS